MSMNSMSMKTMSISFKMLLQTLMDPHKTCGGALHARRLREGGRGLFAPAANPEVSFPPILQPSAKVTVAYLESAMTGLKGGAIRGDQGHLMTGERKRITIRGD